MSSDIYRDGYTQNRELSWLRFNERVLDEAVGSEVPLLEKLKFVSIFSSNLDEFFMIRVGSLFDLYLLEPDNVDDKSGMIAKEQLREIYKEVVHLSSKCEKIFGEIEEQLRLYGVYSLNMSELSPSESKYVKTYYKNNIEPIISPQIVDPHHPFPHFPNKSIYVGTILKHKNQDLFGVIPIPNSLPEILILPGSEMRYILISKIVMEFAGNLFSVYELSEKVTFCVTRNADIKLDNVSMEDSFESIKVQNTDFRKKMKKLLNKRKRLAPVRLELSNDVSGSFRKYLCEKLNLEPHQVYISSVPMTMKYAFSLQSKLDPMARRNLVFTPFSPQISSTILPNKRVTEQVLEQDVLLSFPYESMDPLLHMIKEAAIDPTVVSIKITIYRLSRKSKLVEYLKLAAENDKDVTVVIELRARFDEQSNIDYSEQLEESGCKVIYGFEGYKVHSKICLITRMIDGKVSYITNIATGNYNENTAKTYCDLSLMTADQYIGSDANEFFKNMAISNIDGKYQHLLVAPMCLKSKLLGMMEEEIAKGPNGSILIKVNSITDVDIIKKLSKASQAGVSVQMIVRGICCILPQVPNKTENIRIINIVGRFLEHARVFRFGQGDEQKMFISSADFMTRNTERRVEVSCPIYDPKIRERINNILELQLNDNIKGREINREGRYIKISNDDVMIDSQQQQIIEAQKLAAIQYEKSKETVSGKFENTKAETKSLGFFGAIKNFFGRRFKKEA